ncbi:MAG: AMP-binding protein [Alphaproteobacteria bacterium]
MTGLPPLRSGLPGVAWPALPNVVAARMLALNYQFQESERMPPAEIRRRQLRQLTALADHCHRAAPRQAERLAAAGHRPGAPLDAATWRRIALLTRRDIQTLGAALHAASAPAEHGAAGPFATSGSTGAPVAGVQTELCLLYFEALSLRDHLWHRRDFRGTMAAIRHIKKSGAAGDSVVIPDWNMSAGAVFGTGACHMFDVFRPVAEQADWLLRLGPDYLLTYPTMLREQVQETVRRGARPRGLKGVATFGEQIGDGLRELVRAAWGVEVCDLYSATEVGYIALQCPERPHYHVQAESCFVEILDEEGRDCGPGETGRVVVTPLHNFAMPLLRYDIGDFATVGEPCPCGRSLPVLTRIVGRVSQTLRRPDGAIVMPGFQDVFLKPGSPVRQFQAVETAPQRIELRLVPARALAAAEEADIVRRTGEAFGPDYRVEIRYVERIPRSAGGKHEDFITMVPR